MDWMNMLQNLGLLLGGGGIGSLLGMVSRNGRKRDKADADAKVAEAQRMMIDNYEERIKDLHATIGMMNDSEAHYIERISQQNHALDDKTEQIWNLTDKLYASESRLNTANERITALTEERDHYREWHCRSPRCVKGNPDPEGRQPPNPKIVGVEYLPPKK